MLRALKDIQDLTLCTHDDLMALSAQAKLYAAEYGLYQLTPPAWLTTLKYQIAQAVMMIHTSVPDAPLPPPVTAEPAATLPPAMTEETPVTPPQPAATAAPAHAKQAPRKQ